MHAGAFAVASLAGAMGSLDPNSPLRGGWEVLASPGAATWDWIGGQFTSLLNGVTGTTTPAAGSEAAMAVIDQLTPEERKLMAMHLRNREDRGRGGSGGSRRCRGRCRGSTVG